MAGKYFSEDGNFIWRTKPRRRLALVGASGEKALEEEIPIWDELYGHEPGRNYLVIPLRGVECSGTPREPVGFRGDLKALVGRSRFGGWNIFATMPIDASTKPLVSRDFVFELGDWPDDWRHGYGLGIDRRDEYLPAPEDILSAKQKLDNYRPTKDREIVLVRMDMPPYLDNVGLWIVGEATGMSRFWGYESLEVKYWEGSKKEEDYHLYNLRTGQYVRKLPLDTPDAYHAARTALLEGWREPTLAGLSGRIGKLRYKLEQRGRLPSEKRKHEGRAPEYKDYSLGEYVFVSYKNAFDIVDHKTTHLALIIQHPLGPLLIPSVPPDDQRFDLVENGYVTRIREGQQEAAGVMFAARRNFGNKWALANQIGRKHKAMIERAYAQ